MIYKPTIKRSPPTEKQIEEAKARFFAEGGEIKKMPKVIILAKKEDKYAVNLV